MADKKPFTGALFMNHTKTSTNAPEFRGNFITEELKFSLSAWEKGKTESYTTSGRGILFSNPNKKEEKHPDWIGSITTPKGSRYYLSAWERESTAGNPYKSIALKEWDNQFTKIEGKYLSLACQDWR